MKNISRRLLPLILLTIIFSCNHSDHKDVDDQGVNIAYTDTGKGDTTLFFVHGWCLNKGYWSNQIVHFSKKYRVVAIDMAGFGESGKNRTDWSTTAYSRDIDSVISQLKLKNVILVGHSMAGDIVLQAAIDNSKTVIGLVGVDNFKSVGIPNDSPGAKIDFDNAIKALKQNFKATTIEYFNDDLFLETTAPAIKKRILNDVSHADTIVAVASMVQGNNFDEYMKLKMVNMKLYLINSTFHQTDTLGLEVNQLPYKLFYIQKTGHFPMIEKPMEFNTALEQVIKDVATQKRLPLNCVVK